MPRGRRPRRVIAFLVVVAIVSGGCGSDDASPAPSTVATQQIVVARPDPIQPCDLVDSERASAIFGVDVQEGQRREQGGALLCDYFAGPEPVVVLLSLTGVTGDEFEDRLVLATLPSEEVQDLDTAADATRWNAGRRMMVSLRGDVMLQVHFVGPRFSDASEALAMGIAVSDALVASVDALGRGPSGSPAPEPNLAELPAPDLAARSFEDNLLFKVEEGEWTVGEGLVATLAYLASDAGVEGVLRDASAFEGFEATGIFDMAFDYASTGDDPQLRGEVSALLQQLVFTPDQLAAMADPAPPALGTARLAAVTTANAEEDCARFYEGRTVQPGVGSCLAADVITVETTTFRLYWPNLEGVQTGWTNAHVELLRATIAETAQETFYRLGRLPSEVVIVLSAERSPKTLMNAIQPDGLDWCTVTVFTNMLDKIDSFFKHTLAHEFGHCFQNAVMPDQQVWLPDRRWREEGLAEYLASVAYPSEDGEERFVTEFLEYELSEVTVDAVGSTASPFGSSGVRSYENVVWFNSLRDSLGGEAALLRLLQSGPTERGPERQLAFLASATGIDEAHHRFARDVADGTVFDVEGDTFPAADTYSGGWYVSPGRTITLEPPAFGVVKWAVTIPAGMRATISIDEVEFGAIQASVRPYDTWAWEALVDGLELDSECEGEVVYLVMATRTKADGDPPSLTLRAASVDELEACAGPTPTPRPRATTPPFDACLVGRWQLDNARHVEFLRLVDRIKAQADSVTLEGSVSLTIEASGAVTLRIDAYHEVEAHDVGAATIRSNGEAHGRWESNGRVMRAIWGELSFRTTVSSFVGGSEVDAPPEWLLQAYDVTSYRCSGTEFVYTYPPAFPPQVWHRVGG